MKKKYLYLIAFIILSIVSYSIREKRKFRNKQTEDITRNFDFVVAINNTSSELGKLIDYKLVGDTIGYNHIKARFGNDKILTNGEIGFSVRCAFWEKMYHGKQIPISENKDLFLEGEFYLTNKQVSNLKYRTINFIIFKDKEGEIRYNNSLDIIDSLKISINPKLSLQKLSISSDHYDNANNSHIITNKLIETFLSNRKVFWTIKEIRTNDKTSYLDSIYKDLSLIFSLKADNSIDTLINWKNVQSNFILKMDSLNVNLKKMYPTQSKEIDNISKSLRDQVASRENIENSIGREVYTYFKLYSDRSLTSNSKDEMINIFPLSKLPILIKTDCSFIDSHQDKTSHYHLKTSIDFDKIKKMDEILGKPMLKNVSSNITYSDESDYFLNRECIPYLITEKYTIKMTDIKMFNNTRIELLN